MRNCASAVLPPDVGKSTITALLAWSSKPCSCSAARCGGNSSKKLLCLVTCETKRVTRELTVCATHHKEPATIFRLATCNQRKIISSCGSLEVCAAFCAASKC